jgi:two-component system response regulator
MNTEPLILLVEDRDDDVQLTLRALQKHRVANRVEVAVNGADALDYLFCRGDHADRDKDDMPHLVLLDLKLPKVGGLEVLAEIRKHARTRRLPVVVLTSSTTEVDLAACYDLGVNSYIRKPIDFNQFIEAVETLGLYWLLINEQPPPVEV